MMWSMEYIKYENNVSSYIHTVHNTVQYRISIYTPFFCNNSKCWLMGSLVEVQLGGSNTGEVQFYTKHDKWKSILGNPNLPNVEILIKCWSRNRPRIKAKIIEKNRYALAYICTRSRWLLLLTYISKTAEITIICIRGDVKIIDE